MGNIINFIVDLVGQLGYFGIFFMMFLESSFFPFPSEVVMIPAGYLAYKNEMNIYLAILFGILGSLSGALFNYFLALKFGRDFLIRFGKYFFFRESNMDNMDTFFKNHGDISTFIGRLIPVVRQYISLPAGITKMNLIKFSFYTSLGAGIWVIMLSVLGYYIGSIFAGGLSVNDVIHAFISKDLTKEELQIKSYVTQMVLFSLASVAIILAIYVFFYKRVMKHEIR